MNTFQSVFQGHFNKKCLTKFNLLDDQFMVEFINDTISFYLKNKKVPFLQKYSVILKQSFNVMPIRDSCIEIINLALRKTNYSTTLDVYKQRIWDYFQEKGLDMESDPPEISQKTIDILATTIFARRAELQKILTEMILDASSDKVLVDYNYSIEMVMSSDSAAKVAQPLMVLELNLKVN